MFRPQAELLKDRDLPPDISSFIMFYVEDPFSGPQERVITVTGYRGLRTSVVLGHRIRM